MPLGGDPRVILRDCAARISPSVVGEVVAETHRSSYHGEDAPFFVSGMAEADLLTDEMRARFEPRGHPWALGAFMDAQLAFAEDLLALAKPAVAAVALALLREGQLDGDALVALVAAAMGGTIAPVSAGVPMPRRPRRAARHGNVANLDPEQRVLGARVPRRRRRGGPPTTNPDSR